MRRSEAGGSRSLHVFALVALAGGPDGRIVQASGLFTPAVIPGAIVPHAGPSFYTRYGDLFAWGTVGIALVAVLAPLGPVVLPS